MKTNIQRKITFDLTKIKEIDLLNSVGVYKITNKINNHFYIGSTDRQFKERFKEHCRYYEMYKEGAHLNSHPVLWAAYDKYGIENFEVELVEILDGKTFEEILEREEYYIQTLNPEYNVCKFPTCGGKPNLGRKLSEEWKQHIGEKSSMYKHSEETLKKVTQNNKNNAVKLQFVNLNTNETLNFTSWVEASEYFGNISPQGLQKAFNRSGIWRKEWKINKLSNQKKKIKVIIENDEEIIFNSYSECDKYFDMWRGYTSELVNKKSSQLIKNKYKFELI